MASHCVLVVDDDVFVRLATMEMLEEAGFHVLEACDAAAALVVLQREPMVDLVCTDVHMPGAMNGIALAMRVQSHHPDTKVIIMSGYSRRSDCPNSIPFLSKPFHSGQLVTLAREQLGVCA